MDENVQYFASHRCTLVSSGGAVLEDGDGIDLVQQYNPRTNQWVEMSKMLIARSGSAACVLNGYIYVVGKFSGNGTRV